MENNQEQLQELTQANPLFQPVDHSGHIYFTSHYFHVIYRQHMTEEGRKPRYARHDNFLQMIRGIPLFHQYVTTNDILEIRREKCPEILRTLFRGNQFKALFLLNATAQAGLTQHLDDQVSMAMAYTINADVGQKALGKAAKRPIDAYPELKAIVELAESVAATRLAAEAAQREAESAKLKAELALQQQQWLTLTEYVYLNKLQRQFPEHQRAPFGHYISGYCAEHGIPVRRQPVSGKAYQAENAYHVEIIEKLLSPWLRRQQAQEYLKPVR